MLVCILYLLNYNKSFDVNKSVTLFVFNLNIKKFYNFNFNINIFLQL